MADGPRRDVDADQAGPPAAGPAPAAYAPARKEVTEVVQPDQDHLGPVGAQFEGSAFRVRHSGIIETPGGPLGAPGREEVAVVQQRKAPPG